MILIASFYDQNEREEKTTGGEIRVSEEDNRQMSH